jgi:transmembrane sensor
LGDETVVHLAPESRLEFAGVGYEREEALFGRAYFAVTPDAARPFRVRLPNGTVEVLGTRFDVDSRGEGLQVAVVEGLVEMAADGGRVRLQANEMGFAVGQDAPRVERVADVYQVIGWLGRFLAFEGTPLSKVAEEIEHRFGMRIEITDSMLSARTVTGWFGDQSPQDLIQGICAAVAATCSIEQNAVRMEP